MGGFFFIKTKIQQKIDGKMHAQKCMSLKKPNA